MGGEAEVNVADLVLRRERANLCPLDMRVHDEPNQNDELS